MEKDYLKPFEQIKPFYSGINQLSVEEIVTGWSSEDITSRLKKSFFGTEDTCHDWMRKPTKTEKGVYLLPNLMVTISKIEKESQGIH